MTAYLVRVRDFTNGSDEPDTSWSRIGMVFVHADGWGHDVVSNAYPVKEMLIN